MALIFLLLGAALLYFLIPKGTLVHEASRLPLFWLRAMSSSLPAARAEKIAYGSHPRQYYLITRPLGPAPPEPTYLVYFHGGSWRWGRPGYFLRHAYQFNQLGYTVVLPAYRTCPAYNFSAIHEDIQLMLQAVWEKHPPGLPFRLFTGGMSAGGHLAAMIAVDPELSGIEGKAPGSLRGFFALGAPLDLQEMPDSFAIRDLAGSRGGALFTAANPAAQLPMANPVPALLIHGAQDGMVPVAAARSFAQSYRPAAGERLQWQPVPGGTHLSIAAWPFRRGLPRQLLLTWLRQQLPERVP